MRRIFTLFKIALGAFVCTIMSHIELLYMRNNNISILFTSALFDVEVFLLEKQFVVAINIVFAQALSCYMTCNTITEHFNVYTFNRIQSKTFFFIKRMSDIVLKQFVFYSAYCIMTLLICCVSCRTTLTADILYVALKSIIPLTYSGAFWGIICGTFSLYMDNRVALTGTITAILSLNLISLFCSEFILKNRMVSIVNPVTSLSLTIDSHLSHLHLDMFVLLLSLLAVICVATFFCRRKDFR